MLVVYIIWIIGIFIATIGDYENIAVTPKQVYECTVYDNGKHKRERNSNRGRESDEC